MVGGFMKFNLKKGLTCGENFHAGYFIRWSGRFAPAPMEKLCPVGCCPGAKRLSNPHWNGSLK